MDTVKRVIQDVLTQILNLFYPGLEFDTAGLAEIMIPCLIVLAAAAVVYLLLKLFPDIRRFAYTVLAAALILLITASVYFPSALVRAGDYAADWLEQRYWATVEEAAEGEEAVSEEGEPSVLPGTAAQ